MIEATHQSVIHHRNGKVNKKPRPDCAVIKIKRFECKIRALDGKTSHRDIARGKSQNAGDIAFSRSSLYWTISLVSAG